MRARHTLRIRKPSIKCKNICLEGLLLCIIALNMQFLFFQLFFFGLTKLGKFATNLMCKTCTCACRSEFGISHLFLTMKLGIA